MVPVGDATTSPFSFLMLFESSHFFFLVILAKGLATLFIFSENLALSFTDPLSCLFSPYFIYFCFNIKFGLICFPTSFRCKAVYLRLVFFVEVGIYCKNFLLKTRFSASDTFWYVICPFTFVSRYFVTSYFFFDPLVVG